MAMLRLQTQEGSPDVLTLGNINLLYKYDFNGGQWHGNAMLFPSWKASLEASPLRNWPAEKNSDDPQVLYDRLYSLTPSGLDND